MSVTKLKNPVKFVLEGVFVVLVESTGFEKKQTTHNSIWVNLECFHWEADKYCALFLGYLLDLCKSWPFDAGHFYIEKMRFNLKKN